MGLSERSVCIKDSEGYYIVFALYSFDNCILVEASYLKNIVLSKGVS